MHNIQLLTRLVGLFLLLGQQALAVVSGINAGSTRAFAAVTGAHVYAENSVLATGTWVKIALDGTEDGIYQITYAQLRGMGFTQPQNVGVYGFGGHALDESFSNGHIDDLPEIPVYNDAQRQRILFYGQGLLRWQYSASRGFVHKQHPYATEACYFLHQKDEPSRTLETLDTQSAGSATTVEDFDQRLLHETESVNIGHTGREMYGESFLYTRAQDFKFDALNAGDLRVTVNFIAGASSNSSFAVHLNGTQIGSANMARRSTSYVFATEGTVDLTTTLGTVSENSDNTTRTASQTATTATATTRAASTTIAPTVRITYTPGSTTPALAHLNYIRLQGKQDLAAPSATDSYLLFRNAQSVGSLLHYSVSGATERVQVWDVTSGHEVRQQLTLNNGGEGLGFVPTEQGLREYALVHLDGTRFPGVKSLGRVANQNLHALPQTHMVIVTAPAFIEQATRLAEFRRQNDGLHVTVVTPQQIYNEYSSGVVDATAIRLFMKQFYDRNIALGTDSANLPLRYLLLFGDGHYNNRRYASTYYYLPTYEMENSLAETSSAVCDDYFGFLDDSEGGKTDYNGRLSISTDVLDLGIGRLPVHSATEAEAVVRKIIAYGQNKYYGSWKNRLLFLSDDDKIQDDATDSPNLHMRHNEQLITSLQDAGHHEFLYRKIYLPAYTQTTTASGTDYPDAKKEFWEALQQGVLLVNFAGHGATSSITHEGMMTTAKAAELNMKYLPVWVTATCDVSRFDDDETSMGETLLFNPNGGAQALFTTTRVVYAQQNLRLNQALIDHLFDRNADGTRFRLGDIMRASKVALGSDFNKLNFCLLGDPSVILAYPEQEMELTAVNGEALTAADGANFSLPALNRVTMRGRILRTGTQLTDTTFNGLVYPTIYDAEQTLTADKGLHQEPIYSFPTRTRKVFTGRDIVSRGEFEFSFVVPEDVSYSTERGLVNLYACSDEGDEAQGYFDRFVCATSTDAATDTIGPSIDYCFLNEATFRSGDVVNATPYFFAQVTDANGINATGNSIGHDLSLTIRSLSNPLLSIRQYSLNDYFRTLTGNSSSGTVGYSLPELEDGTYEATFRVWDSHNNTSSATFQFIVRNAEAPQSVVVQAYPSPVGRDETVTFRILHNRPESADKLTLQIYTQTGQRVAETTATTSASTIVYLNQPASGPTDISDALNADESSLFYGQSALTWTASVAPGIYIYRVFMQSNGSHTSSQTKKLIVR